jgi:hypothetical protein
MIIRNVDVQLNSQTSNFINSISMSKNLFDINIKMISNRCFCGFSHPDVAHCDRAQTDFSVTELVSRKYVKKIIA